MEHDEGPPSHQTEKQEAVSANKLNWKQSKLRFSSTSRGRDSTIAEAYERLGKSVEPNLHSGDTIGTKKSVP